MSYVYLLESTDSCTYVGATINLEKRIRQHNKEISGGAHATGMKVDKGETWERVCYVEGFPDWRAALQFEWRWKQLGRKLPSNLKPVKRRMMALKQLLQSERPTSKSVSYAEWETTPNIVFECTNTENIYSSL
jgi:predicted GIY-YIG superfamily endonuclease